MGFTTDRLGRLQRSLQLALNQEWPQLSAAQKSLSKLRPAVTLIHNFEGVCQRRAERSAGLATGKPDIKKLRTAVPKAVQEALVSNNQVWLFRVSRLSGREQAGLVTFSRDHLHEAVAKRIANDPALEVNSGWIDEGLALEIKTVLDRHQVRSGYAVLSGVTRPVWVMPEKDIKLSGSKCLKGQGVEVLEGI